MTAPPTPSMSERDTARPPRTSMPRAGLFAALRVSLAAGVELALFYALPLDDPDVSPLGFIALTATALAAILTVQSLAILRSPLPALRAIEALAASIPLLLLIFASAYVMLATGDSANFTQALSRSDAIYFSTTVLSTVGFGDISAVSETARLMVTAQMIIDLLVLGAGVKVLTGAAKLGREERTSNTRAADGGSW